MVERTTFNPFFSSKIPVVPNWNVSHSIRQCLNQACVCKTSQFLEQSHDITAPRQRWIHCRISDTVSDLRTATLHGWADPLFAKAQHLLHPPFSFISMKVFALICTRRGRCDSFDQQDPDSHTIYLFSTEKLAQFHSLRCGSLLLFSFFFF